MSEEVLSTLTPDKPKRKQQAKAKDWKPAFIAALRKFGVVRYACEAARIARQTAYEARDTDELFAQAWNEALEEAIDSLEREAWRRAHDGVKKLVLYKGYPVEVTDAETGNSKPLYETEYSDQLLMFLLRAHRADKFTERVRQELTGKDGGPLEVKAIDYSSSITPLAPGSVGDSEPSS